MRAVVTGATGFVGAHLVRYLLSCGDQVVACAFPTVPPSDSPYQQYLLRDAKNPPSASLDWELLDISELEACARVFSKHQPDVVYHLAGMSFIPEAEQNFSGALRSNVAGFDNVCRISHQLQRNIRIVLASSADVYGKVSSHDLPVQESTPVQPINAYSTTKLMAEMVGERWERLGRVSVVTLRPFNHIGPGQDVRFVAPSFAHQLVKIAAGVQPPRLEVGNLASRKDFTDVRDVVRAYRLAGLQGRGRYVICSGASVAVQEILDSLVRISGLDITITHDPARMRPVEVPELYGSYAHAESELGWRPMISLEQSLRDIYGDVQQRFARGELA